MYFSDLLSGAPVLDSVLSAKFQVRKAGETTQQNRRQEKRLRTSRAFAALKERFLFAKPSALVSSRRSAIFY